MPFTRLRQSLIQPNGSITGSLLGTASYAITSSYAMNGGSGGGSTPVVSVASLNNQTILYNFSSSQEATITGLTLTNNNWGINVVEEWNSIPGDLNISSCSLLMHFSGSNNSTTFIDSSPNNLTITSNNGAKITSSISKFGGTSGFFDGTNDYLSVADNERFNFSSGNFTIEFWAYVQNTSSYSWVISQWENSAGSDTNSAFVIFQGPYIAFAFAYNNSISQINVSGTTPLISNNWYNVALVRSGSLMSLYLNGNLESTSSGVGLNVINNSNLPIMIGARYGGTEYFNGYLDELRVTKGIARYTASFATQSVQFPDSLPQYETKYVGLIGGLNDTGSDYGIQKLDDTSLKIRKMSVSGTPVSGSPILSASIDRVYVNVLNYSNISVGSTLLGQAFTAVGSTSSYALSRSVVNPYEIVVAVDGAVQSFNDAYSVTSSTINFTENIPSGSLVDIRYLTTPNVNSASYALTASYALNGGSGGGSVSTGSIVNQTILYNVTTSQDNTITGLNLTGNKWDISVIEEWNSGSIVGDEYYNSCSLLMHFSGSNGSTTFIDNSPVTKSFTVNGNSQISTAQSKFGSSSAYFDGTGDYLSSPSNADYAFGTGDFTIECWAYRSTGNDNGILQISSTAGGLQANATTNLAIASWNSARLFIQANNAEYISTAFTNTVNTWNHYALVRNSGVTKLYFNGNLVTDIGTSGAITDTTNYTGTYLVIGGYYSTTYLWNGYIDELRITKGVARYTTNFTPSIVEFFNYASVTQYATKYIGLIGGLNDSAVDYGVEKLSDSSLKIRKMTASGQPLSGSGTLSASVDRVYVNVLNYENAVITGSISNAVTASFAQTTPSGKSIALSFILG